MEAQMQWSITLDAIDPIGDEYRKGVHDREES